MQDDNSVKELNNLGNELISDGDTLNMKIILKRAEATNTMWINLSLKESLLR